MVEKRLKMALQLKLLNSMVRVFDNEVPHSSPEENVLSALRGQSVFFQVAVLAYENTKATVTVESVFGDDVSVKTVEYVPLKFSDDDRAIMSMNSNAGYDVLRRSDKSPDIIRNIKNGEIKLKANKYLSLWCEAKIKESSPAGEHKITISLCEENGEVSSIEQSLTVYDATLPEQTLLHTEWFHADCLADYYKVPAFSEKHWRICRNFIEAAINRGINVIYTPQFTPPLDTKIGGERTTVQLVDVFCNNGKWSFDFDRLKRWIDMCFELGAKRVEFSHLFTQWGAKAAPKIMATVDGEYKRVFGWDTLVCEGKYPEFLAEYLPKLRAKLDEWGITDKCIFHISDEPNLSNLDAYKEAKNSVAKYLDGLYVSDAVSHYEIVEMGACEHPVPLIDKAEIFIEHEVKDLWTYYCCWPRFSSTSRFLFITLSKTRALGIQLFKYNIKGFLHWGYNFYNTPYSLKHVSPYKKPEFIYDDENPSLHAFPAGDSFIVYPGKGGVPEESPRMIMLYEGFLDARALSYLAELTSDDYAKNLLEEHYGKPLTFDDFPQSNYFYISLRNRVNREIAKALAKK
jgi:hypothetical protein